VYRVLAAERYGTLAGGRDVRVGAKSHKGGQSSGPLEVDRPWDAYADDHIGA